MDLVSVIIPIYNAEAYLDRFIASVANQTYPHLEIILVDDGSTDRSPQICDDWAKKDPRIRAMHQANGGVSAARNAGLQAACGEWIMQVDSDDYIAPDMYAHLYELLKSGADIAECSYVEVAGNDAVFACGYETRSYTAQEAMAEHIQDRVFRQLIWNKLYRRQMADGVRFPANKKIDDEFFTYRALGNANTLIHSTKVCYAYRQQPESVMHSMPISKRIQAVEAKTQRHTYIKAHFPELTNLSARDLWFTCIYQGQLALRELDAGAARSTMADLTTVLKENPIPMQACNAKEKLWLILTRKDIRLACRVRNILKIGL